MTASDSLLDLRDVDLTLDGRAVLRDVTLRTDARRIAVLGRNGSGKTTLARVIAGLQRPDGGQVAIAGIDVGRDRRGALAAVGILFQNSDHQIIFPTVSEELAFGLMQMGQDRATAARGVDAILARFGKTAWRDAPVQSLSGGQKQLVCLMAILAMQPRLIVLDEPFAGLDIPTAMQLRRVLDRIDVALVQITHDPASVTGYDHALWLDSGRIVQQGAAGEVAQAFRARMEELGASDDLTDVAG
ncbi:ABC transporter ATP-binding protein [Sulfitobacter sp. HNIBRBA3233]|uniref:energy-coupling factor ABC transporter ATP-binding protein n=1 Tax=Sulfitobacter marinivivus TaxID=3158558 RepID=UPI0032DE2F88